MLLSTLDDLRIPYHVVGGDLPKRLTTICELLGFAPAMDVDEAIALARTEYGRRDMTLETERAPVTAM
jgi:hypothetical protein